MVRSLSDVRMTVPKTSVAAETGAGEADTFLSGSRQTRRATRTMVLWGLAAACICSLVLLAITPHAWRDGRGSRLRESMVVLDHGGPLLVGRYDGATGAYYSIEMGDDEGEFVYVPAITRLFGVADPLVMLRDLYLILVALTAACYPLVFYRLTRSTLAGVVAPLLFLVCMVSIGFLDIYWVPAWGAFTFLPLVFLLARSWPRFGIVAVAGLSLGASWMSSIRSDSGLGIAIAAAALLVLRGWRWWRLLPALAMVAVLYISINTFVFSAIRADRDHRIGTLAAQRIDVSGKHALWYNAYAGIGYLPNKYGLRYEDGVPAARALHEAPGVVPFSDRFEAVLRRAFLDFVSRHPAEAIRQYGAKLVVTIADLTPYLLIVLLTLPAMLLRGGPQQRDVRRWVLLAIPAWIVAFLPSMVAVPFEAYEQGLYGVTGVIGILGLCWMLECLQRAARERGGVRALMAHAPASWGALWRDTAPGGRSMRISVAAIAVLAVICVGGSILRLQAKHWGGEAAPSGVLMELYPFRS
jgi:hypothetical protein